VHGNNTVIPQHAVDVQCTTVAWPFREQVRVAVEHAARTWCGEDHSQRVNHYRVGMHLVAKLTHPAPLLKE
jgi:hypothetical protein